jgi:hypothetical protein
LLGELIGDHLGESPGLDFVGQEGGRLFLAVKIPPANKETFGLRFEPRTHGLLRDFWISGQICPPTFIGEGITINE